MAGTPDAPRIPPPPRGALGRNVYLLGVVSFFTDVASEMIYPLLPVFLRSSLGAGAGVIGAIEGAAESTAALLKLVSGWWSDRLRRRKPLVVFGYALAGVMRPLVAFAGTASQVMVIRVGDRIGKGIRSSPRDAMIADSTDAAIRGRAFGFHRAADHAGAVLGPLVAFALVEELDVPLRSVFLLAAIPGALAVAILVLGVREPVAALVPRQPKPVLGPAGRLNRSFWVYLAAVLLFTLGNATDAFLLLRASDLGVPVAMLPVLWAALHVVKSLAATPGGALSDRVGRFPTLVAGWAVFAGTYAGFAFATEAWHVWALFGAYGLFFGLTEGAERALVADMVPAEKRGTAFGWFHLAIGLGAFPASVLFGILWDVYGATVPFLVGAAMALAAAVVLVTGVPRARSS